MIGRMPRTIDFNADIGEGCGDDAAILPLVSSASIACGGHAGDDASMAEAVRACGSLGVAAGAHPAWNDREHFGRRTQAASPTQVAALVDEQVRRLAAIADGLGLRLAHVKPHGALYNQAADDIDLARAIATAVAAIDPGLKLYALAGSHLVAAGREAGLAVVEEVFAERAYEADGRLRERGRPGAVIDDLDDAVAQTLAMLREGRVRSHDGQWVAIRAQTLCLHGDRPDAAAFARGLRAAIEAAGFDIRAPGRAHPAE